MTTQTFGPGDYGGYNDWAFSGSGSFWTSWNTSTFNTAILGRITAIAARWDGYSGFCATTTGHNTLWSTGGTKQVGSSTFTATQRGAGTTESMHNSACTDLWQSSLAYFIGYSRTSTHCSIHAWADGAHGGYSGKSAADTNNSGGTVNWGGTVNGGLPVFGTVTVSKVFVRRSGVWKRVYVGTRRTGAWDNQNYVRVRRSGAWTIVNWMQEGERHVPPEGMPVEVNVDGYWELGWLIEDGETSWFGNIDPTTTVWSGRYNSFDSNEVAQERLKAKYEWDKALRDERYQEAKKWHMKFEPSIITKQALEAEELATSMSCGC